MKFKRKEKDMKSVEEIQEMARDATRDAMKLWKIKRERGIYHFQ